MDIINFKSKDLELLNLFIKHAKRGWCEQSDYYIELGKITYTYNLRQGGGGEFIEITSWIKEECNEDERLFFLDMNKKQKRKLKKYLKTIEQKEIYDFIFNKIIEEFKIHDNETQEIYFNNQKSIDLVLNELRAKYL